ncbi:hypothetical protein BH23ACT1_BH23ACT1_15990 [soil metagenome]
MVDRLVADLVVVAHLAFLVFLGVGSLLAWFWPRLVWLHVPAVAWGLISISVGLDCPLTGVEKHFRQSAGEGYSGGFVDRYVEGVVYPERFTPLLRAAVAVAVVVGYVGLASRRRTDEHIRRQGAASATTRARADHRC